jgi:hypothetical protein
MGGQNCEFVQLVQAGASSLPAASQKLAVSLGEALEFDMFRGNHQDFRSLDCDGPSGRIDNKKQISPEADASVGDNTCCILALPLPAPPRSLGIGILGIGRVVQDKSRIQSRIVRVDTAATHQVRWLR